MKDVVKMTIFRRERSDMIIYKIKIKNIFSNIKNEKTKMMKKTDDIIYSKLQIKKMK